jgi:hypothetical protein
LSRRRAQEWLCRALPMAKQMVTAFDPNHIEPGSRQSSDNIPASKAGSRVIQQRKRAERPQTRAARLRVTAGDRRDRRDVIALAVTLDHHTELSRHPASPSIGESTIFSPTLESASRGYSPRIAPSRGWRVGMWNLRFWRFLFLLPWKVKDTDREYSMPEIDYSKEASKGCLFNLDVSPPLRSITALKYFNCAIFLNPTTYFTKCRAPTWSGHQTLRGERRK